MHSMLLDEASNVCKTEETNKENVQQGDTTVTVNNHIFIPVTTALTYQEAKKACESRGTVLATICNQQELNALRWETECQYSVGT